MKYLYLYCLLIISGNGLAQTVTAAQIDALLEEIDPAGPGVIIGVVKDQQLLHISQKGLANLDYGIPIGGTSNFRLSSTSKQFTAACVLHLVERGQLQLDATLAKFFPEFSPAIGAVTVQQLLHHTSGIRDYMGLLMLKGSRQMDFFSNFTGEDRDIMELIARQREVAFPSGSAHSYSNTNYWLLGQLVGRISGKSLEAYAKENIFDPLGMTTSGFLQTAGKIVPRRVSGYISECPDCPRLEYRSPTTSVGDDGVVSSIEDLLLWEREFHRPRHLSVRLWQNMLRKGQLNNGEEIDYASGLIVTNFNGEKMIQHGGQNPGFASEILRFPEHDISIIALGNQNWYDVRHYAGEVARLFFPSTAPELPQSDPAPPRPITLPTDKLERFCGDYRFRETNEYRAVELVDGTLVYVRSNGPNSPLLPLSDSVLTFTDRPHIQLRFSFPENGQKSIKWVDPIIGVMHADSYKKPSLTATELAAFAGSYHSEELAGNLEIKTVKQGLQLFISGQQLPLQATTADEFTAMGVFTLRFDRDAAGNITGLRLDAPRAGNIFFGR